jgi:undecaprenyl-phosphate 4-deoxy-4-formamido-L-arabinose transferase
VNLDVLLTWATTRFGAIKVRHEPRQLGASNYTFRKLTAHALNMLTGFSTMPLQMASVLGFALTAVGLVLLVYVIARYVVQGVTVPGFAFLATVIVIFSGAQLFTLGVIGEYLARMHFRVMRQPSYSIRRQVGACEKSVT